MDKCQRQRITLTSLRGMLSAGIGVAVTVGAFLAANYFNLDLPTGSEYLAGAAFALVTWFASKSKFQLAEECMHMARGAEHRNVKPVQLGKAKPVRAMVDPNKKPARPADKPKATGTPAVLNAGSLMDKGRIKVNVEMSEDGSTKVIVVRTSGLSGSDFKGNNGLRPRLENISGVKWDFPKNEGGNRIMSGKVVPGANESEIADKLKSTCERFA